MSPEKKTLKSRLQNGPTEKNELQNHHPPKKAFTKNYMFFSKNLEKKKIQLFSTNQMLEFTGQTWIAQPLLKKLNGDFGPAQTG